MKEQNRLHSLIKFPYFFLIDFEDFHFLASAVPRAGPAPPTIFLWGCPYSPRKDHSNGVRINLCLRTSGPHRLCNGLLVVLGQQNYTCLVRKKKTPFDLLACEIQISYLMRVVSDTIFNSRARCSENIDVTSKFLWNYVMPATVKCCNIYGTQDIKLHKCTPCIGSFFECKRILQGSSLKAFIGYFFKNFMFRRKRE
ncbi:hypothetical protein ACFE04_019761 [Oxalis oulophora]